MTEPGPQDQVDEATVDLLVKQVTEGLSPAEQRALDALQGDVARAYSRDMERAAAAIALAGSANADPLPATLAERLARQAEEHFKVVDIAAARSAATRSVATRSAATPKAPAGSGAYGWLAAAACLVLAIFAWNRSPQPAAPTAQVTVPPVVAPIAKAVVAPPNVVPPTAAEERAALLAKSGTLKIALGATKDPAAAGVTGDVVWDPATQRGYLHFSGLAPNDPAKHQYQLWIFDGARDQRYPVDGGVFDVPANQSDVVIPIRAALMVHKPAAFAVTIEKPGGTVVSGREHVVVLGAAG